MPKFPDFDERTLLTYRECMCGWWCATGEGDVAPICPCCGRSVMPASIGSTERLGFSAVLVQEREAVARGNGPGRDERHFDPAEIGEDLMERGLPVIRLWGGSPPWYPPPGDLDPGQKKSDWTAEGEKLAFFRGEDDAES